MAINHVTFLQDLAATATRNGEYTGTPLTDVAGDGSYNSYLGCNRAGSNAPGIGIGTGDLSYLAAETGVERPEKFTLEDQAAAGRTPQDSQHIGGSGIGAGDGTNEPIRFIVQPASVPGTVDVNDTANMVVADTAAVDGAEADSVTGGLNETGATIAIGDILWSRVAVA